MSRESVLRITLFAIVLAGVAAIAVAYLRATSPGPMPAPKPYRPADYTLSLERHECEGDCPAFELTIQGDGVAVLSGPGPAKAPLRQRTSWQLSHRIDAATHLALITTAEAGGFRTLDREYSIDVIDLPGTKIAVRSPDGASTTYVYGVPCESYAKTLDWQQRKQWDFDKPVPEIFCTLADRLDAVACEVLQRGQPRDNASRLLYPPDCPP